MTPPTTAFLMVLLLAAPAWAEDRQPANAPAETSPRGPQAVDSLELSAEEEEALADLAALIEVIANAELVDDAVSAYNAANLIDRGNVLVNLAYMRKMLTFGRVDYAVYGARWVLSTHPNNALALSVIGYQDASAGDVEKALPGIIRALDQLPDDEGLLTDAAQLLAWLDVQEEDTAWPEDVDRIIATNREQWETQPSFRQAYAAAAAVLQQFDPAVSEAEVLVEEIRHAGLSIEDEIELLNERIVPIELEIYSLYLELDAVETELIGTYWSTAQLQQQVKDANAQIAELEAIDPRTDVQELELVQRRADVVFYKQAIKSSYRQWDRHQLRERADELRDMIRANQREIDQLVVLIRQLHRQRRDAKDDFKQAKAELVVLESDRRKTIRGIGRLLDWRLPAIDGVEIDVGQARQEYADRTQNNDRRTLSDEANAAGKLQLAKKYIEIDKPDMAIKYLQLLLETFPDSQAAGEARQLLEELQEQTEAQ